MRLLVLVVMMGACAHPAPAGLAPVAPVAVPEPVELKVSAGAYAQLAEETERHARERLVAQRHAVVDGARDVVEIEITNIGTAVEKGAYQYCVKLTGRVVRDGARVASLDTVRERCDVVRFTNGGRADPVGLAIAVVMASAEALAPEPTPVGVESKLFVAALDELTDALGRQVVRRN